MFTPESNPDMGSQKQVTTRTLPETSFPCSMQLSQAGHGLTAGREGQMFTPESNPDMGSQKQVTIRTLPETAFPCSMQLSQTRLGRYALSFSSGHCGIPSRQKCRCQRVCLPKAKCASLSAFLFYKSQHVTSVAKLQQQKSVGR